MKPLFNSSELATYSILEEVTERCGYKVFAKVRVADVLPIEGSGICNDSYSYALKSHFDFIVVNSQLKPEFAVEFDGPLHSTKKQKKRDDIKNKLCSRFGFPLLRTVDSHISQTYRGMTILS